VFEGPADHLGRRESAQDVERDEGQYDILERQMFLEL
jgi:hypothetical protein